ncbi:MAG TPA: site-2 protease family protein [Thermoplasmatales archaeon]|nr:site-2 protease family protein [Thermoplasmatales archaeon]
MEWRSYPDESNVEEIKKIVEKYFRVYETQAEDLMAFFIDLPSDEEILRQKFDFLREDLKKRNLIPFLREKNGEYVIIVAYKPPVKGKPPWINIVLFVVTIITTMLSGALLFLGENESLMQIFEMEKLLNGLIFFSAPLLAILGIHELGHYFTSKKHGVAASLPFFIPIPPNPFLPLGTMGAVISMREPIPDRRTLLDIGVAGPIAGFLVSIPVLIIGLSMSSLIEISKIPEGVPMLGDNLFIMILSTLMFKVPEGYTISLHPTAFAGWVGLLVTAINLLPAGQLDGGHVARAVLREKHRYASFATIIFLAALTFLGIGNWLFLLLLLVFLIGTEHPPALNEYISLDTKRKLLALVALLIFILSFTPMPISAR